MRCLGIDYGTKRVGVAISDETNSLAFPVETLSNDKDLVQKVVALIREHTISHLVVGESKDLSGKENVVMKDIKIFVEEIKKESNCEVIFEPEFWSTVEATRYQKEGRLTDASAAAVILQNYLDRY